MTKSRTKTLRNVLPSSSSFVLRGRHDGVRNSREADGGKSDRSLSVNTQQQRTKARRQLGSQSRTGACGMCSRPIVDPTSQHFCVINPALGWAAAAAALRSITLDHRTNFTCPALRARVYLSLSPLPVQQHPQNFYRLSNPNRVSSSSHHRRTPSGAH